MSLSFDRSVLSLATGVVGNSVGLSISESIVLLISESWGGKSSFVVISASFMMMVEGECEDDDCSCGDGCGGDGDGNSNNSFCASMDKGMNPKN